MNNITIDIQCKIVGTFNDSDDEIQIGEVYMDDNKRLILGLKLNESILNNDNEICVTPLKDADNNFILNGSVGKLTLFKYVQNKSNF